MTGANTLSATQPVVEFIRDEPAELDFFDTHTRLADAITATILHHPDTKVVGLLGRWGSGKSTVAKRIIKLLESDGSTKFRVFNYDAWLHQDDPVRRSFLESLLRHLVDVDAVKKGKWNKKLKELSGQIEDTETIEAPTLSKAGHWLVVSLLAVPVGVGLLGLDTIKAAFGAEATLLGRRTFWLALALIAMPALVWFVRYLWQRPWKRVFERGTKRINAPEFFASTDEDGSPTAALRLFTNREVKRTNTRTLRAGQPDSIEFGRVFQEIMQEANADGHRLVILIDNLDRIGMKDAVQMWGTIRSFFLAEHETEDSKYESFHPTVILPIDKSAIEQMFAADGDTPGPDRAASFIDKTFDITFEVTEPVGSDWRAFLEKQMRHVFKGAYQTQWGFWTRRLFERELPASATIVTPREINKLLNRIAALYVQWYDAGIALEVMALYIVQRHRIEENGLLAYISGSDVNIAHIAPDWQRQLAALHYGVPVAKAAQVLIEVPLRSAVVALDRDKFAELALIPGFGETFEFIADDLPTADTLPDIAEFHVLGNAALLLDGLGPGEEEWKAAAWRNIVARYLRSNGADVPGDDLPVRLKCLSARLAPGQIAEYVKLTASGLSGLLAKATTRWQSNNAVATAAAQLILLAKGHDVAPPVFPLEIEPKAFLHRLSALSNLPLVSAQIRTSHSDGAIVEALRGMIQARNDQTYAANAVRSLASSFGDEIYGGDAQIDWGALAQLAADVARNPDNFDAAPVPAIRLLAELAPVLDDNDLLLALIDDGVFNGALQKAQETKSWSDMSALIALLLWRGAKFEAPDGVRWAQVGVVNSKRNEQVIAALRRYFPETVFDILWTSHAKNLWPTRDMIEELIGHLVESGDLGPFDAHKVFENLPTYRLAVPSKLRDRFLEILEQKADFLSEMASTSMGPQILEALDYLHRAGGDDVKRAEEIVRQRLETADIEVWKNAVLTGKEPYHIALKALDRGETLFARRSAFYEALHYYIGHMARTAGRDIRLRWFELSALLKTKARRELLQALANGLGDSAPDQILALLKAGGLNFLKHGGFASGPGSSARHVVVSQLLKKDGRDWLKDNAAEVNSWLVRIDAKSRDEVRDALRVLKRSRLEERRYSAELLLDHWNLDH